MRSFTTRIAAACVALLLSVSASASSDMFLQIKPEKGDAKIVRCADGACVVDLPAAGKYSVRVCDSTGKVIPSDVSLDYSVVSPRDSASGQATGKRQHGSITITKEWNRRTAAANLIAIDEPGTQLVIGTSAEAVDAGQAKITKSRSNIQNN